MILPAASADSADLGASADPKRPSTSNAADRNSRTTAYPGGFNANEILPHGEQAAGQKKPSVADYGDAVAQSQRVSTTAPASGPSSDENWGNGFRVGNWQTGKNANVRGGQKKTLPEDNSNWRYDPQNQTKSTSKKGHPNNDYFNGTGGANNFDYYVNPSTIAINNVVMNNNAPATAAANGYNNGNNHAMYQTDNWRNGVAPVDGRSYSNSTTENNFSPTKGSQFFSPLASKGGVSAVGKSHNHYSGGKAGLGIHVNDFSGSSADADWRSASTTSPGGGRSPGTKFK